jgi:murein DD-endopeptidase MepM/ murein hydrolase activator NlpD
VSPAQRNRSAALKASGFEESPALTVQSTDGDIPHGRELSFAWLAGTVMTGLTSLLLMGSALYVSFQGQDTFSTAYEALQIVTGPTSEIVDDVGKGDRIRPTVKAKSELEVVEASIKEKVDGRDMIRKQPFVRIRATLATTATSLTDDIPAYDPVKILEANEPIVTADDDASNPDIYGADVEGEVSIRTVAMPSTLVPPRAISDQAAANYVRIAVDNLFGDGGTIAGGSDLALAYAPADLGIRELGIVEGGVSGIAENVSVVPQSKTAESAGQGRQEKFVTIKDTGPLADTLLRNGFTDQTAEMMTSTLRNVLPSMTMPEGARLRMLFGPSRASEVLIPYRMSIYFPDANGAPVHAATAALTDRGSYVLGLAPAEITFPEEDVESTDVAALPTLYRAIWETARKHQIDDATTQRIVAMFAYDIDLTKKINGGDSIELLETKDDGTDKRELLYVALRLGTTLRELYRFRTDDGTVDYFDPSGETGKRFLTRRPVKGGGRLSSRFGTRVHPIFKTRRMHTGVDLAAPTGTPIYASGDGIIEKAGWASGYGKKVEIEHVNGFETAYGHMSRIADGIKAGTRVRQGQIIGYVGSTGNSTGPHLHFEIKVNGRMVDPLSVKLPRDKSLSAKYDQPFKQTIAQIRDLMQREAAPITVASSD